MSPVVDHQRDVEGRLVGGLVERRERAPRIGRLHLRDGVLPAVRLADVEASQLVVEDAGVRDVDRRRPGRHLPAAP